MKKYKNNKKKAKREQNKQKIKAQNTSYINI